MLHLFSFASLLFLPFITFASGSYTDILWEELIPETERKFMMEMMELTRNPHGIPLDPNENLSVQLDRVTDLIQDPDYQGLMNSINVRSELDQKDIRLPGFIVPLEVNSENAVTEFFLVPYYGACIHVPPPPPNQIVFVNYVRGLPLQDITTPFYVSGRLSTELYEDDIAVTAYTMVAETISVYTDRR
jgi:hypothetical protein